MNAQTPPDEQLEVATGKAPHKADGVILVAEVEGAQLKVEKDEAPHEAAKRHEAAVE